MQYVILVLFFLGGFGAFSQTASIAESVEYDPTNNRFLCSNDATSIVEIDPSGSLSYFGNGLQSSLGMEIIGNHLFSIVATSQNPPVNVIKAYNLTTEMEMSSLTIPAATILNGMASDGVSKIWVTDFFGQAIYEVDYSNVSSPSFELLVDNLPNQPNGITYDEMNNRLVFVSWNDSIIRQVNLIDSTISPVYDTLNLSNMDGIDLDSDHNFYVSSWNPSSIITKYSNDFSTNELLNIPGLFNPADISIAKEINVLAIPSAQQNVILWPLSSLSTSSNEKTYLKKEIVIHPNPVNDFSNLKISNINWELMDCTITNLQGHVIEKFTFRKNEDNTLKLNFSEYPSGYYTASFIIDNLFTINKKLIISH